MDVGGLERAVFGGSRLLAIIAVIGSIAGALLMFFLGAVYTYDAFAHLLAEGSAYAEDVPRGDRVVIYLISALDRFLIAVVLLYFAYGLYGLFVRPDRSPRELGLPSWLHVERIGELKQTLAEVIIVILFVLFLRVALETFHRKELDLTLVAMAEFLLLPFAIVLLATALRLAELNPKSKKNPDADAPIVCKD